MRFAKKDSVMRFATAFYGMKKTLTKATFSSGLVKFSLTTRTRNFTLICTVGYSLFPNVKNIAFLLCALFRMIVLLKG